MDNAMKKKDTKHYECRDCDKSFSCSSNLIKHQRTHTNEKPFNCKQCGKAFICSSNLTKHMVTHTGERPFKCADCGQSFAQSNSLKFHSLKHGAELKYECTECQKRFPSAYSLKVHARVHTDERPYKCEDCGKFYRCKNYLKQHIAKVHLKERKLTCMECGMMFIRYRELRSHLVKAHGDESFTCEICKKKLCSSRTLRMHIRSHKEDKKCPECGECFRDDTSLQRHLTTHNKANKEKYNRQIYGQMYNHYYSWLMYHMHMMATTHSKRVESSYQCTICGKACKNEHGLSIHMHSHKNKNKGTDKPSVATSSDNGIKQKIDKNYNESLSFHESVSITKSFQSDNIQSNESGNDNIRTSIGNELVSDENEQISQSFLNTTAETTEESQKAEQNKNPVTTEYLDTNYNTESILKPAVVDYIFVNKNHINHNNNNEFTISNTTFEKIENDSDIITID